MKRKVEHNNSNENRSGLHIHRDSFFQNPKPENQNSISRLILNRNYPKKPNRKVRMVKTPLFLDPFIS